MRYTKIALLVFGLGLVLGLVVVAVEIKSLERLASGLMALGIAAIPIALILDWRRGRAMHAQPAARQGADAPRPAANPASAKTGAPKR